MGKGSNTTTTQSTSGADPQAAQAYRDLLSRAQGVASTPYQGYTGELTAPVNAQQTQGINNINANANFAQAPVNQALGIAGNAANPLTQAQIQQYQNPYTQDVVNATQAQFNNQNAQAQQGLTGNAIAQGALGGNRVGVAQANLAGQQQLAQAPVIAGLYNQSYQQGLATAGQQFQQNPLAAAGQIANFGISGQGAALSGAGAQLGAGTLQQQTQQAQDQALYNQYVQAQAYPYQQTQWLAGIDTGVGPGLGSTSSGTTTGPAPNQTAQYLGAGIAAAGLFLNRGGRVGFAHGGVVPQHMADGGVSGTPWAGAQGWIPSIQVHASAPPKGSAPGIASQPSFDANKVASQITGLGGKLSGPSYGGGNFFTDAYGGSSASPLEGLSAADYGAGFKRGGVVGYAGGGVPGIDYSDPSWDNPDVGSGLAPANFADRFAPANDSPFGEMSRGQGLALGIAGKSGTVAPQSIPGGEPEPASDPGFVYRDVSPDAMDDWRKGNPVPPAGTAPMRAADDSDAEEPANATPTSGIAGPSGGAYTPPYQITPADYMPPAQDKSSFGLGYLSPNAKTGLLAAGLGMLANRSPFLGNAIGEGGLTGLAAYGSAEERDRKVAEEAQKLSLEAKKAANDLAHQTFVTNETTRHNKATEANAADKAPAGYQKAPDGTLAFIKGGPHDPEQIALETSAKTKKGTEIDDDTVDAIAQRVAQGDTRAVIGLGRNPAAIAQIQKRVAGIFKEQGLDHEAGAKAILGNIADQAGRMTAERTQAGIASKLAVYGRNVDNAIGVAEKASSEANRTSFTPVNVAINSFKANSGDPKIVALGQALNTLTNEYARAIGSGHGTVHDKEQAETQLNQARSHEQLVAIMKVMRQEIQMTKKSMPEARQEMRELYSRPSSETMRPAGSPELPATFNPPPGAIPRVYNGKTYYYDPQTKQPFPGQ